MTLKTENQKKQEATDAAIYRDWLKLTSNPENSRTVAAERLMKKYGKCRSTIWKACNRAEARSLLFFYLRRVGFTPPQISDLTGHSRQCISQHILGFADRCKVSGKILVIMMKEIEKMLQMN